MLHNGRIMVTSIGGLHRPPRNKTTGESTYLTEPAQPSKSWTYLDLKDKKMKWGPELPMARIYHCVVRYNESTAFAFGGGDVGGENGKGHLLNEYKYKEAFVKELRSGFFMRFPDPNRPDYYLISEVISITHA